MRDERTQQVNQRRSHVQHERGLAHQVPQGVQGRPVSAVRAEEVHPASALHLLQLALHEPAQETAHQEARQILQLFSR